MASGFLTTLCFGPLADISGWFREPASTVAREVDWLFYAITWVCAFFFVLIVALMVLFVVWYRNRPGHRAQESAHHNNALEVAWSVIPLIIVVWMFYMGFVGYMEMRQAPENAYEVGVIAKKWAWSFDYNNGELIHPELHVVKDQPVRLMMTSHDVIHSLYVPAFRVKMDCVPGKYTDLWFTPTRVANPDDGDGERDADEGGFDLFCTEYCGTGHSAMYAKVIVHETKADWEAWMREAMDVRKNPPVEVGRELYQSRGCSQCHSLTGVDNPGPGGPSFKGHFGETVQFTDGTSAEVDEDYLRESILDPQAHIRSGYAAIMPTFRGQLNEDEIYGLIQFIKSLNDVATQDWPEPEGEEGAEGAAAGDEDAAQPSDGTEPAADASGEANQAADSPAEGEQQASSGGADPADDAPPSGEANAQQADTGDDQTSTAETDAEATEAEMTSGGESENAESDAEESGGEETSGDEAPAEESDSAASQEDTGASL